jgi:carotenoid cleavage dioxygenase
VNHAGKTLALVESSLPNQITNELETLGASTSAASWPTR